MSACARCGLLEVDDYPDDGDESVCFARYGYETHRLECRDRELANLRTLLRSVTGKLETALDSLQDGDAQTCERNLSSVLEALS